MYSFASPASLSLGFMLESAHDFNPGASACTGAQKGSPGKASCASLWVPKGSTCSLYRNCDVISPRSGQIPRVTLGTCKYLQSVG